MMLDKLPVSGHYANLDKSRTRISCACIRCRWGCLDIFLSSVIALFLPLARYRLKYSLKGPFNPK